MKGEDPGVVTGLAATVTVGLGMAAGGVAGGDGAKAELGVA